MTEVFIYITTSSDAEAEKIAQALLEEKLIGCANIFPIKSMYWWEGRIAKEHEVVLIAKTLDEKYGRVKKVVEQLHSYKIPCITKIPVQTNDAYGTWLRENIK